MDTEYKETEMSKYARQWLGERFETGEIDPGYSDPEYNPQLRMALIRGLPEQDSSAICDIISNNFTQTELMKKCVELNLSEDEIHDIIKTGIRKQFDGWPRNGSTYGMARKRYISWCKTFCLEPDEGFYAYKVSTRLPFDIE